MKPDARTHRMENASVYCRYCGAHPNNWQREQCEHREPDASTAREHAETVRSLLDEICTDSLECKVEHLLRDRVHSESQEVSALFVAMHDALRERDNLRREISFRSYVTLTQQRRAEAAEARAVQAERERDELLIERGEWDSWKNHAEACQRERDEAVDGMHGHD